jgi:hypothetical protein
MGATWRGMAETRAALLSLSRGASDLDGWTAVGQVVADAAQQLVPVRSGSLRNSIAVARTTANSATVAAEIRYARFVHDGSKHNPDPVPFLTQAVDRSTAQIRAAAENAVRRAARAAGFP